jgi:hypothetical protein
MEKKSDLGSKTSWIPDPPFSIQDTIQYFNTNV